MTGASRFISVVTLLNRTSSTPQRDGTMSSGSTNPASQLSMGAISSPKPNQFHDASARISAVIATGNWFVVALTSLPFRTDPPSLVNSLRSTPSAVTLPFPCVFTGIVPLENPLIHCCGRNRPRMVLLRTPLSNGWTVLLAVACITLHLRKIQCERSLKSNTTDVRIQGKHRISCA